MHPLIIEPNELQRILSDDQLLIVDLSRPEIWAQGHIPGAVHLAPTEIISGVKPAVGKLPPVDQLNSVFSKLGYSPNKHIVACDDEGGGWAGRFLWTLDVIGHKDMSLLNGGIIAWAAEGLPISNTEQAVQPTNVSVNIDNRYIATQAQVLNSLDDPQTLVWDARSPQEYSGNRKASARGGHIPGAINLDWTEVMDPARGLRVLEDVADVLNSHGITRDKKVITHCQTHHRSGLTYVVGKSLGYDIRAYDGSWAEWGNDPNTPIEN